MGPIFDPQIADLTDQDRDRCTFLDTKKIRIAIEKVAVLKNDTIVIAQMVLLLFTGPIESIVTIQIKSKVTEVLFFRFGRNK